MKFIYEYRTPDNAKHNGVICASDSEAAYAALKKQGIKPSRFSEAPGLFNKLFGKGKRWMAIGFLAAVAVVLAVSRSRTPPSPLPTSVDAVLDSTTRRQPIGDAAVIDEGIRTGWSEVFDLEGERFLASFAIPGTHPSVRVTTEDALEKALAHQPSKSHSEASSLEVRQIRAMVEGMKQELREFLAAGGTISSYGRKLVQRQEDELAYYRRAKNEVENALRSGEAREDIERLLRKNNSALRKMGIRPVVIQTEE